MEKELKSYTTRCPNRAWPSQGGMAVACQVSPQKNTPAGFQFFFYNALLHYQQKIGDLFCPVIFLNFHTVWTMSRESFALLILIKRFAFWVRNLSFVSSIFVLERVLRHFCNVLLQDKGSMKQNIAEMSQDKK